MRAILTLIFILTPLWVFSQDSTGVKKEIIYQTLGQPFPFETGVSISEAQYNFFFRTYALKGIQNTVNSGIEKAPKVVYVDKIVHDKKEGNKVVYFLTGTTAGIILTATLALLIKK